MASREPVEVQAALVVLGQVDATRTTDRLPGRAHGRRPRGRRPAAATAGSHDLPDPLGCAGPAHGHRRPPVGPRVVGERRSDPVMLCGPQLTSPGVPDRRGPAHGRITRDEPAETRRPPAPTPPRRARSRARWSRCATVLALVLRLRPAARDATARRALTPDAVEQVRAPDASPTSLALAVAAGAAEPAPDRRGRAGRRRRARPSSAQAATSTPTSSAACTRPACGRRRIARPRPGAPRPPRAADGPRRLAAATRTRRRGADATPTARWHALVASVATAARRAGRARSPRLPASPGCRPPVPRGGHRRRAPALPPTPTGRRRARRRGPGGLRRRARPAARSACSPRTRGGVRARGDRRQALRRPARARRLRARVVHRGRARGVGGAAGIDGTAQDPRRASYTLPAGLDDPAVATALGRTLETDAGRRLRDAGRRGRPGRAGRHRRAVAAATAAGRGLGRHACPAPRPAGAAPDS